MAESSWESNTNKRNEICDTLQPRVWGYKKADEANLRKHDEVVEMLQSAWSANCNLLLNDGPLPDGGINPPEATTFREVGKRLRADGLIAK